MDVDRQIRSASPLEATARKLAISVRSVQRLMTSLTDRMGAVSRFQAGVEAVRRGWV